VVLFEGETVEMAQEMSEEMGKESYTEF